VTLGATPSAGSINWYSGLTGGSSLQTGSSYTTPSINTTTTYYVDATNNGCTTVTRTAVVATVNTTPLTPVANSISLKYNGLQQSIPDLILPTGQSISWFNASTGGVSSTKPQGKNVASYNSYASAIIDATGCVSLTRTFIELTITKAPLIITGIAGANKIYDGTTNVTINGTASYVGLVASDAGLAVTGTPSFNFNNKNVGNSKPITVTGFTAPSPNYTLTQPADLVGSITPKTASINIVANNKEYDGTTTATLNNISSPSFIAGDIVNINYTAAVFDTKDPGTNKTVTVTGINLGGVDAFNYNLTNTTATAIANITGAITSSIRPFVLPNAFTPNGDTKNTEFKFIVNDPSKITLRLFQIYNRNGKLMFSTNDISKGWDGRYNGVIQDMGVYFVKYRIDINGASPSVDTVPFYLLK
jgi:gliding motility-associated-like protein